MKKLIIAIIVIVLVGVGVYFLKDSSSYETDVEVDTQEPVSDSDEIDVEEDIVAEVNEKETVLGKSVGGQDIIAYHYGSGEKEILFVGGIHGGYSGNTSLVAYELIDYLEDDSSVIPENERVTVIPVLNPDGLDKIFGTTGRFAAADIPSSQAERTPGRFNGNDVDLNRNFDCDWQSSGTWQNTTVDGGTKAFSEPESRALRSYVEKNNPDAVVVWYSAAGGVFSSNCHDGVLPETQTITNLYADASGYKAYESFDFYEITGDAVNWLAKEGIPAISVLLTTHEGVEWDKNLKGIKALFEYYAE